MKRGFKAQAERLAVEVRERVGLNDRQRLDPLKLCAHLDIGVMGLEEIRGFNDHKVHLHETDPYAFSAALLIGPVGRLMVINRSHSPGRLANSMAHEVSHLLLEHLPRPAFDELGNRVWPAEEENEANWLAGCLVAPRSGLISQVTTLEMDFARAAAHYGISDELFRQRWNQTGCAHQVARRKRR